MNQMIKGSGAIDQSQGQSGAIDQLREQSGVIDQTQPILMTETRAKKIKIIQPQEIKVNVYVKTEQTLHMEINVDQGTPYNEFVNEVNARVLAQREQDYYENYVTYILDERVEISLTDTSSLKNLGFYDGCKFEAKLKLKGG